MKIKKIYNKEKLIEILSKSVKKYSPYTYMGEGIVVSPGSERSLIISHFNNGLFSLGEDVFLEFENLKYPIYVRQEKTKINIISNSLIDYLWEEFCTNIKSGKTLYVFIKELGLQPSSNSELNCRVEDRFIELRLKGEL